MTEIQRARDVLAKWRKSTTLGPWASSGEYDFPAVYANGELLADVQTDSLADAVLIVGTAGNPDLLDAIDGMLATWDEAEFVSADLGYHIQRIAAAIIAADERMNA